MANESLSLEEIQAFFDEKGVDQICPHCRRNDWTWVDSTPGTELYVPSRGGMGSALLLTLYCNHCAGIQLYSRSRILEWRKERNGGSL